MNQGYLLVCPECEGQGHRNASDRFSYHFYTEDRTEWQLHPHLVIEWTTEGEWLQSCITMACGDPTVDTMDGDSFDDSSIYFDWGTGGGNYGVRGSQGTYAIGSLATSGMDVSRAFVRWNLEHIPPDAIIHQVSMGLWEYAAGPWPYATCSDGTPAGGYSCSCLLYTSDAADE